METPFVPNPGTNNTIYNGSNERRCYVEALVIDLKNCSSGVIDEHEFYNTMPMNCILYDLLNAEHAGTQEAFIADFQCLYLEYYNYIDRLR